MQRYLLVFFVVIASVADEPLECYSCVKVSPPVLCARSTDRDHPPCKVPFCKSNRVRCENEDDNCIALTQVHVGTVLNLFGCDTCDSIRMKAPTAKCVECREDLCNTVAPTSCDIV